MSKTAELIPNKKERGKRGGGNASGIPSDVWTDTGDTSRVGKWK